MNTNIIQNNKPAEHWDERYPLGNGNIGIMESGDISSEVISINDDRLWSGYGKDKNVRKKGNVVLPKVRELLDKNAYFRAERLLAKNFLGDWCETYLPMGDLTITCEQMNFEQYKRELDLEKSLQTITAKTNFGELKTKSFVSFKSRTYVSLQETSEKLSYTFNMTSKLRFEVQSEVTDNEATIIIKGVAPSKHMSRKPFTSEYDEKNKGANWVVVLKIISDSKCVKDENTIKVENCKQYTTFVSTDVSFEKTFDQMICDCKNNIEKAKAKAFDELLKEHIQDVSELYNRCVLELDGEDYDLTTEQLLRKSREIDSNKLVNLLFNFGKYLTIASSRENTNPSNLQGIWNDQLFPAWFSNYTLNINTQMNYWPTLGLDLANCNMPLMDFLALLSEKGKITARDTFGMSGWVCGHNSDNSGLSNFNMGPEIAVDAYRLVCAYFVSNSGWLSTHIYEHYMHTLDDEFLKKYFDILQDSLRFYMDYVSIDTKTGKYTMSPSTSPENRFYYKGLRHSVNTGSAVELSLVEYLSNCYFELCDALIKINHEELIDNDLKIKAKEVKSKLKKPTISDSGRIVEWDKDYKETEVGHRHNCHMFALHPANLWSEETPEYFEACKKSMEKRGIYSTGWSMAWKSNIYARLKENNLAREALLFQLTLAGREKRRDNFDGGSYSSLLCACPPFQIDGNFGAVAGIMEILVQSHLGYIEFLPALPKQWASGKMKGMRVRGGYKVNFSWENGKIKEYEIFHKDRTSANVKIGGEIIEVSTKRLVG